MKRLYLGTKTDTERIHIMITLAVMFFIFVHSAMPGEISGDESGYFARILASITGLSFQTAQFIVRKAAHFTEFTVLGVCLAANFNDLASRDELTEADRNTAKKVLMKHPKLAAWIAGTLYAGTDEFHQLFVEGRNCTLRDVCIDSAGVAFGIAVTAAVKAIKGDYRKR